MSKTLSPLLRSCFEALDHGLWHFFRSTMATDMKFALLHVDQAIELILKERVRRAGKSIYKSPKETLSIHGAYDALEKLGITIPEKPDLEMLHEERNNIQHKTAHLSPDDANFYVEKAVIFLIRFSKDELGIDLYQHVPSEYLKNIVG